MKTAFQIVLFVLLLSLVAESAWSRKRRTYVIKKGDTPAQVAKRFKVSYEEILRFNQMKPGDSFRPGQTLEIPYPGEVTGSKYKVKPGDSIARIADFHGVSQDDLRTANGLRKTAKVRVGQLLTIPHGLRGGINRGHRCVRGDEILKKPVFGHTGITGLRYRHECGHFRCFCNRCADRAG